MLRPQVNLEYLYGQNGYLFPRHDHVVIGGTVEESNDEAVDPDRCRALVEHMAGVFGRLPAVPMPVFHPRRSIAP